MAKTAPTSLAKRFPDRDEVAAVRAEAEALEAGAEAAETRRVAGRILGRRGHGKLVFLDLVDRSGQIQLLCSADRTGPVELDLGDVVGAIGKAAKTRRGEPSLAVDELVLLAKIKRPLPDTYHGLVDAETRYRKRYLDLLVNEDTRRAFVLRSRMVSSIRRHLDEAGFVEVETPVLQPRYGGAFADPFVTHHNELDADLYLRIATELYLKRLIVGGLEKVYEIGKDFRNEGVSYKHQPEFTMLEWYEAFADYTDTMARIEQLVAAAAVDTVGTTEVEFRGHRVNLAPPWQRLKLADALEELGFWTRDEADLRARLEERGVDTAADRSWSQLVDHALSHFVEPELIQPTILHDYPVELSPFARTMDDDPSFTERFEYFAAGMELGNAYSELNDPDEQAQRFAEQAAAIGGVQGDPDFVEALSYGMPPTGGLGLGIDRLAMLLSGRETIRDVILFPALNEPSEFIDVSFPDRWWFHEIASLLPAEWWDDEVLPAAAELLSQWRSRRDRIERLDSEIVNLQVPQLGPRPPEWRDLKVLVLRSVAETLQVDLAKYSNPIDRLGQIRKEIPVWGDQAGMQHVVRGTFNGLGLLAAVRAGESLEALNVQQAFLRRHVAPRSIT